MLSLLRSAVALGRLEQSKGRHDAGEGQGKEFGPSDSPQRVKQAPMPKPDKMLRVRPLKELEAAVSKLKRVVLFHPKPIVELLPPRYCICGKDEKKGGKKVLPMIQCDECWEWFHFVCVGIKEGTDTKNMAYKCGWCKSEVDKEGYQRNKGLRKVAKRRHYKDAPKFKADNPEQEQAPRYSAPPDWEGKVAEVQELARRAAIKKRKLTEAVENMVVQDGHHLVDAEGMAGLELRAVDQGLVDEMVEAGMVDPDEIGDDD